MSGKNKSKSKTKGKQTKGKTKGKTTKGQQKGKKQNSQQKDNKQFRRRRRPKRKPLRKRGRQAIPESELNFLNPSEGDVLKLLAAQTHIGRRRAHVNMKRYIWKRRQDGVHVINLEKTWAKLVLAARILVTVAEPKDICVMSTRNHGQRGAIKFAHYTGCTAMVGKWVPGTFTNPQNKAFYEPRVLIVDDPSTCFAALRETSYIGVPVIAFCGVDNNTRFVDCAIPCNNRGTLSVGLMFWLLTREFLTIKGEVVRGEWNESVDLFFYRDANEIQRQQETKDRKARKRQQAELAQQYQQQYGQQELEQQMQQQQQLIQQQQQQQMAVQQAADPYADQRAGVDEKSWEMPDPQGLEDWDGAANQQQPPLVAPPVIGDVADDQAQYNANQQGFDPNAYPQQQGYDPNAQIPTVPW